LNKSEKLAFLTEADKSLLHWARAIIPKAFYRPFSPYLHGSMMNFMEAPVDFSVDVVERCKQGLMPRGSGKSSLFVTTNVVRRVCMERFNYAYLGANTYDQAEERLATVKWQFENNPKIHTLFGDMRGDIWRADMLTFKNGLKIKAVGASGQARGRQNLDMSRPDWAIGDDLESPESAASEEQTAKILNWWLADVLGSLNPDTGWAQLWGTMLSGSSVLAQLAAAHPERTLILELFDDQYKSRWPEVYPDEWIEQKRAAAVKEGKLDQLWSEYRNIAIAGENQRFTQDMFDYWSGYQEDINREDFIVVLIADPGHTSKKTSDPSAMHAVGFSEYGDIWDLEYSNNQITNGDFYAEVARLVRKWEIPEVYVDDTGAKEYITVPLQQYLAEQGIWCEVKTVPSKGSKEDRMLGLRPLYLAKKIKHNAQQCFELESQELMFPKAPKKDLHDCLAYAPFVAAEKNLGLLPKPSLVELAEERTRGIIHMRTV
jgi:hypothetical protein